jgi:hypothetical protein
VTLSSSFGAAEVKNMPIHATNISFGIDWHKNNERLIEKKLEHIIATCQKINLVNNNSSTQVFILKDNLFVFATSTGDLEPEPEFYGEWMIFEKINNRYKIRAVMKLE